MANIRKKHGAEVKAKVAMAAIRARTPLFTLMSNCEKPSCWYPFTSPVIGYARAFDAMAQRSPALLPHESLRRVLEIWGVVQSVPEEGLALVTIGKRDIIF